jgi:phosphate transport system substrate-binding protein
LHHLKPPVGDRPRKILLLNRALLTRGIATILLAIAPIVADCRAQSTTIPAYAATRHASGTIHIWGSPQMRDLLQRFEADFKKYQPDVSFVDELKSTVSAVAGVYTDRAEIGLLGRELWPDELEAFTSVKGHPPIAIEIATGSYDVPKATFALMIFVHRSNPIGELSMEQLSRIFSSSAAQDSARTWGDIGLKGAWAKRPIHLYGFAKDNDKAMIFRKLVFRSEAQWSCGLHEFSNSSGPPPADAGESIVRAVAEDPNGIGISNIHYATGDVKALPLSPGEHEPAVPPTRDNIASRAYPLTRAVYMVVDEDPNRPTKPAVAEFLSYVLSAQGQRDVLGEGNYLPLTPAVAAQQRRLIAGP